MKKKIVLLLAMIMILAIPMTSFAKDEVTTAEFLKDALELAKVKVGVDIESDLTDTVDAEYIPYVEAAYSNDFISEDAKMKVNEEITKEEAVVILVKVFGQRAKVSEVTEEMIDKTMKFSDNESIDPSAKPYITYAIQNDLIERSKAVFYPSMNLSKQTARDMMYYAKESAEKNFTRKGLSAGQMLLEANEKLLELKTYKANADMTMNMEMKAEGLPADDEMGEQLLKQGMNMDMDMKLDMQVKNPDQIYINQTAKMNIDMPEEANVEQETVAETFMDKGVMYQKTDLTGEKWIKTDMSSVLGQIQSLQGNNPQNMMQLSSEQLEFYKNYAWYSDDEKIDGKDYYVINVDIDKEAYKKFFQEYTEKVMDAVLAQQQETNPLENEGEAEMAKMMVTQMLQQMDIEVSYKFYIDKESMGYDKMWMSQNMYMNMDSLIQMIAAMSEEEDTDLSEVKIEMVIRAEGEIDYTDFNGEVTMPVIGEEDIFNFNAEIMTEE
ncbi:hypothetical protein R9X47_17280 [Wukongibacter baidiensis]|uniref:hypothetical protein n=1 Tax=Wukongibacter baidiensis TaxID=1723361 RepID=UPI003D7FC6FE